MNLLYIGCHCVLEYDDVRMFRDLGYSVFSTDFYRNPAAPTANVRPALENVSPVDGAEETYAREGLTDETCLQCENFVNLFDVVVVIQKYNAFNLTNMDAIIKGPLYIFRNIGQSSAQMEKRLQRIAQISKIVRYSPYEDRFEGAARTDAVIRFGKDLSDFETWRGDDKTLLTFMMSVTRRPEAMNFDVYKLVTAHVPRILYGFSNVDLGVPNRPGVSYDEMRRLFAQHAIYYVGHTIPACYTLNFIEAACAGMPLVAMGHGIIDYGYRQDFGATGRLYEVPDMMSAAGIDTCFDSIWEGRNILTHLLENEVERKEQSQAVQRMARENFDKAKISIEWQRFIEANV